VGAQQRLTDSGLPGYLRGLGLVDDGGAVRVEPAGDGNINWVRRAIIEGNPPRSVIVKQARPALERFPQYQAPTERIVCEARYLERARPFDPEGVCPRLLRFDEASRVLVLEDLGAAERLDAALARSADVSGPLAALARFLARVHRGTRGRPELAAAFANEPMQRLHGDHIFALPYQPNDFALPPRTAARAAQLRGDAALVAAAARAYERYLTPEGALVHGDVQAGNVLLPPGGVKLLDAEISHVGDPAFDVGMLLAHAALPAAARGEAAGARPLLERCWQAYASEHGAAGLPALGAALRYAGLELLRRTVGAARVAAVADDEAGLRAIDAGLALVRKGALAAL
jgi:5-methylthioribose kinase